jgi:hypothetical protein
MPRTDEATFFVDSTTGQVGKHVPARPRDREILVVRLAHRVTPGAHRPRWFELRYWPDFYLIRQRHTSMVIGPGKA